MTALSQSRAVTIARGIAAQNGLSLDADALAAAVARLTMDLGINEDLALVFEIATPFHVERGQVIDAQPFNHALSIVREHGKPAEQEPETPIAAPARPKPGGPVSEIGRALAAQHDVSMIRETERMKNPWLPGQINRTNQTIITNKNPALAEKFRKEAAL